MKVIFSEKQNAHSPTRYLRYGALVDYPESPERVRRLIAGALKAELELSEPRSFDARHFEGIHPARYLDFLENGHAEWMKLPGAFPEIMPSIRPVEEPSAYPSHILGRRRLAHHGFCRRRHRRHLGHRPFLGDERPHCGRSRRLGHGLGLCALPPARPSCLWRARRRLLLSQQFGARRAISAPHA